MEPVIDVPEEAEEPLTTIRTHRRNQLLAWIQPRRPETINYHHALRLFDVNGRNQSGEEELAEPDEIKKHQKKERFPAPPPIRTKQHALRDGAKYLWSQIASLYRTFYYSRRSCLAL